MDPCLIGIPLHQYRSHTSGCCISARHLAVGMARALWGGLAIAPQDAVGHLVKTEPFQARLLKYILCVFWIVAWLLA